MTPTEALLLSGHVSGCPLSTCHFQITPFHLGTSKRQVEKKKKVATFSSLKCNIDAQKKYLQNTLLISIILSITKDFKSPVVDLGVALIW